MELSTKGVLVGARPSHSLVYENVGSKFYCMASDVSEHCEMPKQVVGQTAAKDKKIVADSGCEVDNISCISKADAVNGTFVGCSGDNGQKNLTGSSGSVNSFVPVGSEKPLDVQSFKHFPATVESVIKCNNQFEGSPQYATEALQPPADFSDKSDPSETSSFRDDQIDAISPKVGPSVERGVNLVGDDLNHAHNDADPFNPEAKFHGDRNIGAASYISEQNGDLDLKGPFNVKEPPQQCQVVVDNDPAVELVDVRVCDICGDVGRERLLALCSKCSDGAEHTYCMRIKMDKLPEGDWLCEECMEMDNLHNVPVQIEKGVDITPKKTSSSENGQGSGILSVVDSSKDTKRAKLDHASLPSSLGKRPGPSLLLNPTSKKRAVDEDVTLPASSTFSVQPLSMKDSHLNSRGEGVCCTPVESAGGESSREVLEKARVPAAASQHMVGSIKDPGLEVHSHNDGGSRKRNFVVKNGTTRARKEFILSSMRRCESFRVSSPVSPVASELKKNVGNDTNSPNRGIKCRIPQRSQSFHLKTSHPLSPLSSSGVLRVKADKAAPSSNEVKRPLVLTKERHSTDVAESYKMSKKSTVNHPDSKCLSSIFRSTDVPGSDEKMLHSDPGKDKRSTNSLKGSNGYCDSKAEEKTSDMKVDCSPKETKSLKEKTIFQLNSSPSTFLAAASHPNLDCVWRGIFKVEERGKLPLQCDGLQAHLSTSASPKILELVSKWPYEITLKETLKRDIWPDQFQKSGTTETNIALYFFAESLNSYGRYEKFLNCMARNDLALYSDVDGVELLIFPSHYLPENSSRWNKLFYLWGVLKAKHSSGLNIDVDVANTQKEIENCEPVCVPSGSQLPCPDLREHQNGSVSAAAHVLVSTQGHRDNGLKEHQSADITDSADVQKENMCQDSEKNAVCVLGSENASHSHPAIVGSAAFLNQSGFTSIRDHQTNASLRCSQNGFPSAMDSLLHAVDVIENSKTSQGSFSVDSGPNHVGWNGKQVDHEMEPADKYSIDHPLNLELSLWDKRKLENCGELDLILGLVNGKDDQLDYHDNSCGEARGCSDGGGDVSLDLSLALPSVNERLVLMTGNELLPEKNDVDTSLQLFGGGRKA